MKVGKIIYKAISSLILLSLVTLVILLVGTKLVGFTPYAVLSGSMEPKYPVGSVVYVKKVKDNTVKVGDTITFYMENNSTVVTHQVIKKDEEKGLYYTQGLANDAADGQPTTIDHIIGKVYYCVPYLGYIASYIMEPPILYIMVAVILIWIIIMCMIDISTEAIKDHKESKCNETQSGKTEVNTNNI